MSTSPITSNQSSLSLAWQQSISSRSTSAGDTDGGSDGSVPSAAKSDSSSISPQASALLQAEQNGNAHGGGHRHHHKLTDAQASQVGAKIQAKDPALFKQLDQDGDGKLSASELKTGMDKLRQQGQQPDASASDQTAPTADAGTSALDTIRQAVREVFASERQQAQPAAQTAGTDPSASTSA